MNGPTPEDRALNYLIVNDTTFNSTQLLALNSMMTNMVQFRIRQRYALLTLWFQQAYTKTTWTNTTGWLVNANECDDWFGIQCAPINVKGDVGIKNVVTIDFYENNAQGTIPADLGLITALTSFSAGSNSLKGTLPASIGQLTALTLFDVGSNLLTGTLPTSIDSWSQIQTALFFFNQFTGAMPDGICQYIDENDTLAADCGEITCPLKTCCTACF
jgi:hypothetical protein